MDFLQATNWVVEEAVHLFFSQDGIRSYNLQSLILSIHIHDFSICIVCYVFFLCCIFIYVSILISFC